MHSRIKLIQGDITRLQADAIVNAANTSLLGGGGVDGAIHRAGGSAVLDECKQIRARQGGCKTGEAVITTAGKMPAKYVIHTVGPVYRQAKAEQASQLLASSYRNSLLLAVQHGIKTIAFPNISTGIYYFPKREAAAIAIDTVKRFLIENDTLTEVIFVCFDEENLGIYQQILNP